MVAAARKQMSVILKEMALTLFADADAIPSSEAVAAALLLAHVAWQRANGDDFPDTAYGAALIEMERERPTLWHELKSPDAATLVADLVAYKKSRYPGDRRKVVACGAYDNKVRVEWTD